MSKARIITRSRIVPLTCAATMSFACQSSRPMTEPTPGPEIVADSVIGHYALTVTPEPECAQIPPSARSRTYSADIERSTTGADYVITLSDATFLSGVICPAAGSPGLGCNQFRASRAGDNVLRFDLVEEFPGDEFGGVGGTIVEVLPTGNWLAVGGTGLGRRDGQDIDAVIDGHLWYCSSVRDYCRQSVRCESSLRLTFTRNKMAP